MDALPGKQPLIKRTFRPPNYETPVAHFRHALTPNELFYVRWHMGVPDLARRDWRLRVAGPAALRQREFTYAQLRRRFPAHEVVAVNQCSGNRRGLFRPHVPGVQWGYGAMGNAAWRGVRLKDVLEDAGIAPVALELQADGADQPMLSGPDFVKSLPMWKALDADTLIAFEMNGEPLSRWHGFPSRLVVPGWTATYWVKTLTELTLRDSPCEGFWMKTGYRVPRGLFGASGFESQDTEQNSPITTIRVNSLVVAPEPGTTIPAGRPGELLGIAWDGGSGIARVEVSQDGGASWREAALDRALGRYSWRHWRSPLQARQPGVVEFMVRAFARDGSTQSPSLVANPAGYHHNVVQRVRYLVA
ncbi:MAG TPA: molybdopterin-dependent oxidoreductase [Steroidobacteraceae bacterium]|nr:molybdopterin-dependent oxidoreductase [Steroidobacteraceae bacterium]